MKQTDHASGFYDLASEEALCAIMKAALLQQKFITPPSILADGAVRSILSLRLSRQELSLY
ncbi:hypothetical protein RLO149_c040020 [Roseobacter litoralis Och 149]|uniref:Uncharacterized protein n=1 Tax=Roseobacter litoralis (strain ATCC 49566 / DSM 6996 / JCM 21268 / NBRC 15278 / OCh 149) TaxID=391595 RepID=F7ZEK4_ROSLO|nr:hypothetical protein RLO149_c040020 [Roseobacter litoralis Och 149]